MITLTRELLDTVKNETELWRFVKLAERVSLDTDGLIAMTYKELALLWDTDISSVNRQLDRWEKNAIIITKESEKTSDKNRRKKGNIFLNNIKFVLHQCENKPQTNETKAAQIPEKKRETIGSDFNSNLPSPPPPKADNTHHRSYPQPQKINLLTYRDDPAAACLPFVIVKNPDGSFAKVRRASFHTQPPLDSNEYNLELAAWTTGAFFFTQALGLDYRAGTIKLAEAGNGLTEEQARTKAYRLAEQKIKDAGSGNLPVGTAIFLAALNEIVEHYANAKKRLNQGRKTILEWLISTELEDKIAHFKAAPAKAIEAYGRVGESGYDFKTEAERFITEATRRDQIRQGIIAGFASQLAPALPVNWRKFVDRDEEELIKNLSAQNGGKTTRQAATLPPLDEKILDRQVLSRNHKEPQGV